MAIAPVPDKPHYKRSEVYKTRQRDYMKRWRSDNKARVSEYMTKWHADHSDHELKYRKLYNANRKWLKRYGLTYATYVEMAAAQNWACAICHFVPSGEGRDRLAVDHDHETGAVRGLLCQHCNRGIGQLHDDPDLLYAASEYLSIHKRPLLRIAS